MRKDTVFYIDPQSYRNLSTYDYSLLCKVSDFNIYYLCSKYYDSKRHEWIHYHPIFSYNQIKGKLPKALCYIYNYLLVLTLIVRYRPRLIHLQWVRLPRFEYYFYKIVTNVFKTNFVYTAHNVLPLHTGDKEKEIYSKLYHLATHIIVHTEDTRSQLLRLFGLDGEKVSVIQHGRLKLEYDSKLYEAQVTDYDKKYQLRNDQIIFTSLGEQSRYKGADIIADVWANTPELNQNNNCKLVMVGKQRGIDLTQLKQFSNVIVDDRMIPNEEYYYLLTHADVYLLTYRKTSFSQSGALMTALTERIPVLVTDVGGLADPLKIADIGWCVKDVCQKNQLKDMILHILGNKEKIQKIKADTESWEKVYKFYDWERLSLQTQALYHQVIEQQH